MGSLPTLNPPQPIDVGKLVQLKSLIQAQPYQQEALEQEQQSRGLAIQQQQLQLQQERAIQSAWQQAFTNDPQTGAPKLDEDKFLSVAGQAGAGSQAQAALEHFANYHKIQNENAEAQQKLAVGQRDEAGAAGYALQQLNYEPQAAKALLNQRLNDPNLDPQHKQSYSQMVQAIDAAMGQGDDAARKIVKQIADPMVAQSPVYSKIQEESIASQARALTAQTGLQRLTAELPGGVLEPPDRRELNAWLKKNPGKDAADFLKYKASLAPQAQINVANAAGGGLSDPATDQAAWRYLQTGQLPPGARGVVGLAQNRKIMNRAAELDPNASLAGNAAVTAANRDSLKQLQAQTDRVEAFENTAIKNMDMFLDKAKAVPDLGTRFANVPLRMITGKMIGDQKQAELQAALQTARTEAARVLSSASAAGVIPVEQQREVEDMLNGNLPYKAMAGVVATLKSDMANRKQSYNDQIGDIKRRFGSSMQGANPAQNAQPLEITLPSGKKISIK